MFSVATYDFLLLMENLTFRSVHTYGYSLFYSWQLWYLLSVFFVIASICIMAEHKIKDKNIFKIMMAIFLMGGYRSTNDS